MNPRIQDRRVSRTRKTLKKALIELVKEKGYPSISIQDLTDRANLGKATFYLHYRDKDELLTECFNSVLIELTELTETLPPMHWNKQDPRLLQIAFEFAAKNADFIKIMMHDQSGAKFFQQLSFIVADLIKTTIQQGIESEEVKTIVPLDFLCNYYAGAILSTIEWWINYGMKYTVNEMVEMVSKTIDLSRTEIVEKPGIG